MIKEEAKWIAKIIRLHEDVFFPLLNLGSSTALFRKTIQPWIDEFVFNPSLIKNNKVIHCDLKEDEGVDIAGNILEKKFTKYLKSYNFKSIICSNVLEHIEDPSKFCDAIESIAFSGSYIIITVPYLYPYHKDPIDTKFRPDINAIIRLFPHCQLQEAQIYVSNENHFTSLIKNPSSFFFTFKNWLIPRHGFKEWKMRWKDVPNLFKKYKFTWVLLKKI
jgi:hypothetical protein